MGVIKMSQALTLRADPVGSLATTGVLHPSPEEVCETAPGRLLPESHFPSNHAAGDAGTLADLGKDWQRYEKRDRMRLIWISLFFSLLLHAILLLSLIGAELYIF
jgi:hypothetical protein